MCKTFLIMVCSISGTMANLNVTVMHNPMSNVTTDNQSVTVSEKKVLSEIFSAPNSTEISKSVEKETPKPHILLKIHRRITRSKDAVWATITLTFMCVLLLIAVAQSRMWKDYRAPESQGVPLPNFNERVLFKDVMEHKLNSLKQFFQKKKKQRKNKSEMESLLTPGEWDDDESDIPVP